MKGRLAIQESCQLGMKPSENKTRKNKNKKKKVSELWSSLPVEVVLSCLAKLSRLDIEAFASTCKRHWSLITDSNDLWDLRWLLGRRCIDPSLYVCLHVVPEPTPRWFILHPVQRLLKPIPLHNRDQRYHPPVSSSFVVSKYGIFIIGGLINGKPTSEVAFFLCFNHRWYNFPPMKMARAFASARILHGKIYVFGGCPDDTDSSNWAEVFDIDTSTWEFVSVSTPKKPLNIQHSVARKNGEEIYAVDEDGQNLSFLPSKCMFVASGKTESKSGHRNDWCLIRGLLFCRATSMRILWCFPDEMDWKEVKGLEELHRYYDRWGYEINRLCGNSVKGIRKIVVFWNAQPQGPESFELWSAEINIVRRKESEGLELWGEIVWCGSVFQLDPQSNWYNVKVLNAEFVYV